MASFSFPITFLFKITTLSNDFTATDARGQTVAYVRQKLFKLKEDINLYSDETRAQLIYNIKADKWLDFNTAYSFTNRHGEELGKIVRKGWNSLWKAHYELVDTQQQIQYHIREENPWVKVLDGVIGAIPLLNLFTGYLLNPSYVVLDHQEQVIARLKKTPSMVGRRFEVDKVSPTSGDDDERIMLGLMMLVLLERRRG